MNASSHLQPLKNLHPSDPIVFKGSGEALEVWSCASRMDPRWVWLTSVKDQRAITLLPTLIQDLLIPMKSLFFERLAGLHQGEWRLCPVPPHPKSLLRREISPQHHFACALRAHSRTQSPQSKIHLSYSPRTLYRSRESLRQRFLSRQLRLHAQEDSLAAHQVQGPVVLIDDVTTTGATLREATRALKRRGCPQVIALVMFSA